MKNEMSEFLSGKLLFGDNFTPDEIDQWFADEAEGYANLGAKEKKKYSYGYHELNTYHGFRFIQNMKFTNALGIGSAYGDELKPIANLIDQITILDPSEAFSDISEILDTPCNYIKPNASGIMPFENNNFDLITCLGVMHHIPNVSQVMAECYRCLNKDGVMLLREPIVSMGDWRKPRTGLTKRERGIPLDIMDNIIKNAGFKIQQRSLCNFPLIPKLANKLNIDTYNSKSMTFIDYIMSQLFSWNIKYHRTKLFEKFAPASIYYVLEK